MRLNEITAVPTVAFISELFESSNDYLWHGSRNEIPVLTPQPAVDTGGNPKSNKKAIYATADKNFAIAMGLAEKGSDTAGFPNDPQLVLFSGKIRHGQMVYLHKLPMYDANGRPLFEPGGNDREFTSVPGVTKLKPIEVEEVPVDQHLNLIRQPTPKDLKLKKYYLQRAKRAKRGVNEAFDQPYPVKWEKGEFGDYDALATLSDGTYLSIMFNREEDGEYQIEFHRNHSQDVTGEGDAQRVFATVLGAIQQFIKKQHPELVRFSATKDDDGDNQSRSKLYDRLVQRYANSWGYSVDVSDYAGSTVYELTNDLNEAKVIENQQVSTEDMINYIRKHHDNNLHSDYTSYIANTFTGFELEDVPVHSIKTDLPKLDRAKVEQYKTMDFSKAPPIVIGDGFILDGYHRANVAKALGIPTIRAYVGVKQVAEGQRQPLDFDSLYGKVFKITDNNGNPNTPGFSIVTPLNGASWNWQERPEFKKIVKQKLNDPGFLGDHKYQQIVDAMAGKLFDPAKHLVKEITAVPTVAKSKREHLDVMPNDGRPIPRGDEEHYLGKLVADMGHGLQLWSWTDRGTVTYYVFDTNTRTSQLGTTGRPYTSNRNSFVVQGVYSGPKNQYRAADLYAFLILNQGLTLVSDNKQSAGGYRVWQELEQRYGRRINIHGFDTSTDQGVNVTTKDEPDTHVARGDIKKAGPQMKRELGTISRDLRFVASAR